MGENEFRKGLEELINRTSMENGCNTPDFILADYLNRCLTAFDLAVNARETWFSRAPEVKVASDSMGAPSEEAAQHPDTLRLNYIDAWIANGRQRGFNWDAMRFEMALSAREQLDIYRNKPVPTRPAPPCRRPISNGYPCPDYPNCECAGERLVEGTSESSLTDAENAAMDRDIMRAVARDEKPNRF